ncbi:MAG: sugar ABC transporter permease YjfF [Lachnospiraceae bacterium]|nr:sugar ABC transporter permease YjfF [Lachnospiraceae bacterium]
MRKKKKERNVNTLFLMITVFLFVLLYIVGMVKFGNRGFAKLQVFLNLFNNNAALILIAIGETMVIITGGIDISVGTTLGWTCMIVAYSIEFKGMPVWQAFLLALVTGLVFGIVKGYCVAYLRIQPFIVTLAGQFFAAGAAAMIYQQMVSVTDELFVKLANWKWTFPFFGTTNKRGIVTYPSISGSALIALAAVVIFYLIMKYSKFGRNLYAVGGNETSAMLMGLNVRRTKFMAYVITSVLAAIGGIAFVLNTSGASLGQGEGREMNAITAAVLGGTLMTGGVGNVFGTLVGTMVIALIESLISFQGTLSSWWGKIVIASLMCVFIVLQSLLSAKSQKKKGDTSHV